jgi:hypothetical protein
MADNSSISTFTFYKNVTSILDNATNCFNVTSNASEMTIKFICTGTFQAKVYAGIIDKENMYPYPVFKLPDYTMITDIITDSNCLYNVDLSAIDYIKIELVALTGNISVYGKAVG